MIVLIATNEQKLALEGKYNDAELRFVKDGNGDWVVNDAVLFDDDFISIREQLKDLPQVEFIQPNNDK
jgi:hypothetical protein